MNRNQFLLAASILSADFRSLEDQLKQTIDAGADWIHIDVMDGHFVPNISMGPFIVETCRKITPLPLDVHLMITNPDQFIPAFVSAGADMLSIHIENPGASDSIQHIHSHKVKAGIVLNPETKLSRLRPFCSAVDLVLIMSVNPGYSGQSFLEKSLEKIQAADQLRTATHAGFLLEVDGGIRPENIGRVVNAGADVVVAASAIYNHQNSIARNIAALKDLNNKPQ